MNPLAFLIDTFTKEGFGVFNIPRLSQNYHSTPFASGTWVHKGRITLSKMRQV